MHLNRADQVFFEVIVVNDGSSDDTRECLEKLVELVKYPLRVFHQNNEGRASALKKAVMAATGEFIMVMDDDDRFVLNSLDQVPQDLKNVGKLKNYKRELAGVIYLVNDKDANQLVGTKFPGDGFISNLIKIRADYAVQGDKKELVRRNILQNVMYNIPAGEKRMPTSILWARIAKKYDIYCKNRVLVKKQYLSSGLTSNMTKIRVENPISAMMGYFEVITASRDIFQSRIYRMRNSINYFRFYFHLKNRFSIFYFICSGTAGWMMSIYDRIVCQLKR